MGVGVTINGSPVTTVRIESAELVEQAELGGVGSGTFRIDDQAGTLVTKGFKDIEVTEDLCSDPLLFPGFVGARKIVRGSPRVLAARYIDVTTKDLNDLLQRRAIMGGGNRSAESVGDRIAWILGSPYLSSYVVDSGFVVYPDVDMDPNDYRTQRPSDVLADCATRVNFNYFVYPDPYSAVPSLWFDDSNTSDNYSSVLKFSNVLADIDWVTTFPISPEADLTRDPDDVWSRVIESYENGRVIRTRTATATEFVERDAVAPTSSVKQRAQAIAQGDKYLATHSSERDEFSDTLIVPASKINLFKAGMRAQFRYSHMVPEGYSEFTWLRALETRKRVFVSPGGIPGAPDEPLYSIGLRLSPQEPGPCEPTSIRQEASSGAVVDFVTLPMDVVIGNLLVARLFSRNTDATPNMVDDSWTLLGAGGAHNPEEGSNPRGACAIWAKIADSTSPTISADADADNIYKTVYEIPCGSLENIAVVSADHERAPDVNFATLDMGALSGGPGVAIIGIAIPRGSDQGGNGYTIDYDPSWTEELWQDIDGGGPCDFGPPDPWIWGAFAENVSSIPSSVDATGICTKPPGVGGSLQIVREWCGVAVLIGG